MSRRVIIVLVVIYVIIVAGLYWLAFNPAVHAVIVSLEVVQPEPVMIERTQPDVVESYAQGIPGTWNPQQ